MVTQTEAAKILSTSRDIIASFSKRMLLVPHINPAHRDELLFYQSDVEALAQAKQDEKELTPLEIRVLLKQALSAARSAEIQVSALKARLGLDVAMLDRNPASVRRLYEDARLEVNIDDLQDVTWLRSWASTLLAIDQNYLSLAGTIMDTKEPWLHLLTFAGVVVAKLTEEHADILQFSDKLWDAYQYFKAAQHHLYAVSCILCRATMGKDVTAKLFPSNVLTAKQMLRQVLTPPPSAFP